MTFRIRFYAVGLIVALMTGLLAAPGPKARTAGRRT